MLLFKAIAASALFGAATATHMNVGKRAVLSFHVKFAIADIAADATVDILHNFQTSFVFQYGQNREK